MKPRDVPTIELNGDIISDGAIKGKSSIATAARINPAQKFWKQASINGSTFRFINAKDARSMEAVGIEPIRMLKMISSTLNNGLILT